MPMGSENRTRHVKILVWAVKNGCLYGEIEPQFPLQSCQPVSLSIKKYFMCHEISIPAVTVWLMGREARVLGDGLRL